MLQVVTRHENEGVVIGDNLHVTVLEIGENQIRLGISSPDIEGGYREEVLSWTPQFKEADSAAVGSAALAAVTPGLSPG
ncbi:MAG: carbon storage regulator [Planctomycetaceae bacterium]|nr:carbon storage regulator [Planctomycetaceae bacterium]